VRVSRERVLAASPAEVWEVTLELKQTPAGMARFGALTVRRALRRRLVGALDALAALLQRPAQ